ncbi:hypothetical protein BGX26_003758 [Mortierella sp. AD094]|nr:hypothetical protein BGX26_003758 [Mortierella sp. AD094]
MVAKEIKFIAAGLEAAVADTKPIGILHLADYSVLSYGPDVSRKSKFSFRLSSSENVDHLFHAETPQALDLWIDAIQAHINHALSNLDVLGPLDLDPSRERPGFNRASSLANDPYQPKGEQSIIDKVLDRLQLEDPTLSDMNDPSTLIMPAQEHPSYQHPTQKSFRELQLSLDDNLDGWSPPPSSVLYSSSNASASANTSMSIDVHHISKSSIDASSSQRSPIVIRRANHGTFNSSESFSQSSSSSFTDPYSNYSSYSEVSVGGNSGNKNMRGSMQILDYQGRPSLQQGRGNHGLHSTSSSLSGTQHLNHYYPQLSSPSLHSPRAKGQASSIESGDSIGSYSTVTEKGLMMTPLDSNQKKGKDSGNINVTSGNSKKSNRSKNYCTDSDLSPFEVFDKEAKAAMSNDGKKTKKLWPVYGNSGPATSADKTSGNSSGESGRRSTGQSLDSNSLMLKNLVLVSLPAKKNSNSITTATTKGFSKSMVSLTRGSEFDTRPNLAPPSPASPSEHRNHALFPPEKNTYRTRSPSVSVLEEALQSASHEYSQYIQKQTPTHRPITGDILYSRSPPQVDPTFLKRSIQSQKQHSKQPQSPKAATAPISLITSDWNTISRVQRNISQPVRCVDPELQQLRLHQPYLSPTKPTGNVSRHIVAPDELAMAMSVDQETEGKRQQQELESIDKTEERLIPVIGRAPVVSPTYTPSDYKPHSILTAVPESVSSPSPTLTTVIEATPSLDDDTTSLTNEDISSKLGSSHSSDSTEHQMTVTTAAAWSLPPPKRHNYFVGQEAAAVQQTTREPSSRSFIPSQSTKPAVQMVETRDAKSINVEPGKESYELQGEQGEAHEILLSAIQATETWSTVTVNTGEFLQNTTRESPASPTSPTLPPTLPRRSPFRSAPIPPVNSAYSTPL